MAPWLRKKTGRARRAPPDGGCCGRGRPRRGGYLSCPPARVLSQALGFSFSWGRAQNNGGPGRGLPAFAVPLRAALHAAAGLPPRHRARCCLRPPCAVRLVAALLRLPAAGAPRPLGCLAPRRGGAGGEGTPPTAASSISQPGEPSRVPAAPSRGTLPVAALPPGTPRRQALDCTPGWDERRARRWRGRCAAWSIDRHNRGL